MTVESWVRWVDMNDLFLKTSANSQTYLEKFSRKYYIDRINGILTLERIFESNLQNIPYTNYNVALSLSGNMDMTNVKAAK